MNYKNMKIEINESQPLDEVVRELERLGYRKYDALMSENPAVIEVYADGIYCSYIDDLHVCNPTTLSELKAMTND